MGRLRDTLALAAIGAALAAPAASASESTTASMPAVPAEAPTEPATVTTTPAAPAPDPAPSVHHGTTLVAPPAQVTTPKSHQTSGSVGAGKSKSNSGGGVVAKTKPKPHAQQPSPPTPAISPAQATRPAPILTIPAIPTGSCGSSGVPPILVPIYQRAAAAYNLGPQGAPVLAGINEVETAFGANLNVSSAGAVGWMQFMPSTWETYGVDANGDGVADPYNPEDAIFAAARYLSAAGMPADTYGAIYAYNHADWYVTEVLDNAACYAPFVGGTVGSLPQPQLQVLSCKPTADWNRTIPPEYLEAFEAAAARYDLGRRGVWALAAVARLESNFGRGMSKAELQRQGPLGLDGTEWRHYAVDGNEDARVRHSDPADSAATLARMIWSRGSIRAGVFFHNQAAWYVQAVLAEADRMEGRCKVHYVDWSIALPEVAGSYVSPFSASTELVTGRIDQGVDFVGSGPIMAMGNAQILATGAPGWPEEGGVLYQLLDGPLKGEVIFVYEGVDATVQPGEMVKAGQQIATFRPGGSIETGFADAAGVPLSHGEYYEGKITESGLEMFSLLQALGV
jgi:murein DD-endopeptidase MepM/ murein hydrolase activator NlpD